MEFQTSQPIFVQIYDLICDMILREELNSGDQIPSVRDLAVRLQVNPNTVMRAIERLAGKEIINSRRGLGYFVTESALSTIQSERHNRLLEEYLPRLIEEMRLLGVQVEEVTKEIEKRLNA